MTCAHEGNRQIDTQKRTSPKLEINLADYLKTTDFFKETKNRQFYSHEIYLRALSISKVSTKPS